MKKPEEYLKSRGYEFIGMWDAKGNPIYGHYIKKIYAASPELNFELKIEFMFSGEVYPNFKIYLSILSYDNVQKIDDIFKEAVIFKNNAKLDAKKVRELIYNN